MNHSFSSSSVVGAGGDVGEDVDHPMLSSASSTRRPRSSESRKELGQPREEMQAQGGGDGGGGGGSTLLLQELHEQHMEERAEWEAERGALVAEVGWPIPSFPGLLPLGMTTNTAAARSHRRM
eukprot:jgi/Tetstr1/439038/TSEL_027530.t1